MFSTVQALGSKLQRPFDEVGVTIRVNLPSGESLVLGSGEPTVAITLHTKRAQRQLLALSEQGLAEAYVNGEADIEGSFPDLLKCRDLTKQHHGLGWTARFALPAFLGQVFTNRTAIRRHYELDPEFYLSFLDPTWPAYTQGIFQEPGDTLATATERKFAFAAEACRADSGGHVLEVGPGWGAFVRYLLQRPVEVTAITISPASKAFLEKTISSPKFQVLEEDFLSYQPARKFSAVTIMGVIEHLPDYRRVCRRLLELLQPGGRVYIDASAATTKYAMSPFIYKHVFPYNHSFLHLDEFVTSAKSEGLELLSVDDDSSDYQRTIERWAKNLEAHRERLERRFGQYNFRRFRLYLWGSAASFAQGALQCHRLVLQTPN